MKSIKYITLLILPLLLIAQETERPDDTRRIKTENINWMVENTQGCVMEIKDNEVCFEETWMKAPPGGITITIEDTDTPVSLSSLEAPFWAEVSYYGTDDNVYISSICFLKQFKYDSEGYIIGEYHEDID